MSSAAASAAGAVCGRERAAGIAAGGRVLHDRCNYHANYESGRNPSLLLATRGRPRRRGEAHRSTRLPTGALHDGHNLNVINCKDPGRSRNLVVPEAVVAAVLYKGAEFYGCM